MNKNIIKKALIIGILSLIPFLMTGCGERMKSFVNCNLTDTLMSRIEQNENILEDLHNNGFLDDETFERNKEILSDRREEYKKTIKKSSKSIEECKDADAVAKKIKDMPFYPAIRRIAYIDGDNVRIETGRHYILDDNLDELQVYNVADNVFTGANADSMKSLLLVNYIGSLGKFKVVDLDGKVVTAKPGEGDHLHYYSYGRYEYNSKKYGTYEGFLLADKHNAGTSDKEIESCAIQLINSDLTADLNKRFECPIYVLKSDILSNENGAQSLDNIIKTVQSAITISDSGKATITNEAILLKYFEEAKDINGKTVKLLDGMKEYTEIVGYSKDQPLNGTHTELGWDSIIYQEGVPCFTLRYWEFNQDAVNNLKTLLGLNSYQYIYIQNQTGSNSGKMYLLEYPVYYLSSIKNDLVTQDSNMISGFLKKSGLGVNLLTGKIIKYDPKIDSNGNITGWSKTGTEVSELVDNYLVVGGDTDVSGIGGQSAFIVKGKCKLDVTFTLTGGKTIPKTVETGRIILRDYLEATYAPEMVPSENLVVFGRKIRIDFRQFRDNYPIWNKNEIIAYYVDKNGNKLENTLTLKPTDLCSADWLLNKDKIFRVAQPGITTTIITPAKDIEDGKLKTIDDLEDRQIVQYSDIDITMLFPGPNLGKPDYISDSSSKQRFYAIATTKGIFDSGLYNNWINTSNPDASLDWWNKYLADNNFSYSVLHQDVNDYLLGNYSYELSQSGVVILDLETVAFIQEQMDKESDIERVEVIRTIFILLGWGIICYSLVLILAWIIDTNSDIGIDLLTKLTFGHWIAVKYPEDIPSYDTSDNKYVSASGLMLSVIILIAVGIILLNVNIFDLVIAIIKTFGKFASQVEKMIKGM